MKEVHASPEPERALPMSLATEALHRLRRAGTLSPERVLPELRGYVSRLAGLADTFPAAAVEPFASLEHFLSLLEQDCPADEAELAEAYRELEWRLNRFRNLLAVGRFR